MGHDQSLKDILVNKIDQYIQDLSNPLMPSYMLLTYSERIFGMIEAGYITHILTQEEAFEFTKRIKEII